MLSVCNAVIGEEEEMERCHVEDLLQSNLTARSSEGFQTWFGSLSSLVWKPIKLPPPTCLPAETTLLCEADDRTCEGTAEFSPQHVSVPVLDANECIRPLENITEDTRGISLLAKKMLKRAGTNENVIIADYPNGKEVEWCSCLSVKTKTIHDESQGDLNCVVLKEKFGRKLCNLGLPPNCRGKWVILESNLNNGVCLEDLWEEISEEICKGVVCGCNVSFQMNPSRILIYMDSINCVTVLKHFSSIYERVKKMAYLVHPHGEIASWDGKEIVME